MAKESVKKVKLRVFTLPNRSPRKSKIEIVKQFRERMEGGMKIANNRRMKLSNLEDNKEEDLLSFYSNSSPDYIFGLILRIFPSDLTSNIPEDLMNGEQINLNALKKEDGPVKIMFKDHYYFYLTDSYLITNLQGQSKIKRFQTYINWLLGIDDPEEMYEFNTKVKIVNNYKLKDIENIVFQDSVIYKDHTIQNISGNIFKRTFGDIPEFQNIIDNNILSAKLFVKFKRPENIKKDAYEKFMGAQLNAVADTNDVNIVTKNGKVIKGSEFEYIKDVEISLTSDKKLIEPELLEEMKKLYSELKNETTN